MKTILYILVSVALCLASCTDDIETEPTVQVSVMVTMPESQTRGASDNITRFIVEIYRSGDTSTPLDFKTFDRISDVSLRIPVGEYDFYFWADSGSANYFIPTTLANIIGMGGNPPNGDCFGGVLRNKKIESNNTIDAQLTRRVACINLINSVTAPAEPLPSVTIKYKSIPKAYNMLTGAAVEEVLDSTYTTTYQMAENGLFARTYLFPGATISMEVRVGDRTTIINDLSIVANNMINITGKFTD